MYHHHYRYDYYGGHGIEPLTLLLIFVGIMIALVVIGGCVASPPGKKMSRAQAVSQVKFAVEIKDVGSSLLLIIAMIGGCLAMIQIATQAIGIVGLYGFSAMLLSLVGLFAFRRMFGIGIQSVADWKSIPLTQKKRCRC